jgi:hypothetical protein
LVYSKVRRAGKDDEGDYTTGKMIAENPEPAAAKAELIEGRYDMAEAIS